MKQRVERGAWRGPAALVYALVYALAVEDLLDWLGPVRFAMVNAGVIAVLWFLAETEPRTERYVAPPAEPLDLNERVDAREIMWIAAAAIVLAAVCVRVIPSILR